MSHSEVWSVACKKKRRILLNNQSAYPNARAGHGSHLISSIRGCVFCSLTYQRKRKKAPIIGWRFEQSDISMVPCTSATNVEFRGRSQELAAFFSSKSALYCTTKYTSSGISLSYGRGGWKIWTAKSNDPYAWFILFADALTGRLVPCKGKWQDYISFYVI